MQTNYFSSVKNTVRPQVKICGLTCPDEALQCARMGADVIGLVFYPQSPRNLTPHQAGRICRRLPPDVKAVGVFVNTPFKKIISLAFGCGFYTVQLHGSETPKQVARLAKAGLKVIKTLFTNRHPEIAQASRYDAATTFLVECGRGKLPGGNSLAWNWKLPPGPFRKHPVILAGGLDPENVREALLAGRPGAVDVSSGVETSPGKKDMRKVLAFLSAVKGDPGVNRLTGTRPRNGTF
jgi:phosphoribosylanthranilate isomerase